MRLQNKEAQEFRLQQILALDEEGHNQSEIALIVNCSQCWVSKVIERGRVEGKQNVKSKGVAFGKTAALLKEQLSELSDVLQLEAKASGFETDGWTQKRVAQIIVERYKVQHHPSHISRILQKLGFTSQKPKRKDYRQDEEALREWQKKKLPALKKKR